MNDASRTPPRTLILPPKGLPRLELLELWRSRELLLFLVVRDIMVKYKQAFLGIAWAVLQPLVMMAVFTLFFGILLKVDSTRMPYPLFAFAGLLPWTYFSSALATSSTSLVANRLLITKVFFPRMMLPASSVLAALVDLALSMVVLLALMLYFGVMPSPRLILLLPFIALAMTCALGCSLWLSAINVKYRDVQYAIPALIQIWFFLSPVFYSSQAVPEAFRPVYGLNPMVAVIEGFRWAITDQPFPEPLMMTGSILICLVVLVTGSFYFKRAEREIADMV